MSTAQKTHVLFANQCVENKSVHISFEHMNLQIPAVQLGAFINNLMRVRNALADADIDTGDNNVLMPGPPWDFYHYRTVTDDDETCEIEEFYDLCGAGLFKDVDGPCYPIKDGQANLSIHIYPSKPDNVPAGTTSVVWFDNLEY